MEQMRRLWMAVLCQAYDDLKSEEFGNYWYSQAEAFFRGSGEWLDARQAICDHLGLHPHDLRRPALRIINARRLEHGLPPLRTQAPTPRLPKQRASEPAAAVPKLPRLVAVPAPEPPPRKPRPRTQRRWTYNPFAAYKPFDPYRPLPSEARASALQRPQPDHPHLDLSDAD